MNIEELIYRVADAAFEIRERTQDRDPWMAFYLPDEIQELAQVTLGRNRSRELTSNWIHAILQDILLRHITYNSLFEEAVGELVRQVKDYVESGKVELHTVVPVIGMGADMLYGEKLNLTDDIVLRKIPHWEWAWINRMLRQDTYYANMCLEHIIRIEPEKLDWNMDIDFISRITKTILSNFQMIHPVGMSTPWIIQYVPICQYIHDVGNMSAAGFLMFPGERSNHPYQRSEVEICAERVRMLNSLDQSTQRRTEIALLRYQDATNRLNSYDALMDYWIALEALLGGEDTKYGTARRLSAKIAVLTSNDKEEQYNLLKWLAQVSYTCRNRIAHGGTIDQDALFNILGEMSEITTRCINSILEYRKSYEIINESMKLDVHDLIKRYEKEFGKCTS